MKSETSYINYLKLEQPEIWETILKAEKDGLIVVDEETDSVTATNRLLLTYPGLHDIINMLVEGWNQKKAAAFGQELISNLLK
ncbi:MAG: hypothetical protein HOD92_19160 [Deltaproteobacteria bacterium]|jgi:hypothetical protein|nr:hypothetical protein [Deltaproteobacteria bacterium]MBT4526196.1 hypothetical protein [Deltaproteobacteria bacterium]